MTSSQVASHYNAVKQSGIEERKNSTIFHLRNINNWMKSMLINEALKILKKDGIDHPKVLDLACGKGGDLRKWSIGKVESVVMADIANVSIEQAKGRYEEMRERDGKSLFRAQFITIDCCNNDLNELIDSSFLPIHLASCQFAFHYSFVNEQSARRMMKNAVSNISEGGLFIGTLPDAERIVWAGRNSEEGTSWKNRVCSIQYDSPSSIQSPPLFGATFHFCLDEQVNCPEFLAYFPLLLKLAEEEGMELVWEKRFPQAAKEYLNDRDGRILLEKMTGLKVLPDEKESIIEGEFNHVIEYMNEDGDSIGTLSQSEWEAFSMYIVFLLRKKKKNLST